MCKVGYRGAGVSCITGDDPVRSLLYLRIYGSDVLVVLQGNELQIKVLESLSYYQNVDVAVAA